MRIALVQHHATDDRSDNLSRGLAAAREAAARGADLVCFAELAFEPFYPQTPAGPDPAELAQPIPGPVTAAFCELAKDLGVVIAPNLFEVDGARTFDASPVIDADGRLLGTTRMVHVPDYEGFHEKTYYTPGDRGMPVYDTAVGRIGVAICYDRHYPEVMRSLAIDGAQLVLVPQAGAVDEWPEGLYEAEMRVAAFQNGYFVALCNRVGPEAKVTFAGESFVCDPAGDVIARAGRGTDEILICDVDLARAASSHARRLFLPDRRHELYDSWLARPSRLVDAAATVLEPGPDAQVSLRDVTEENVFPVLKLSKGLSPNQRKMVASNATSLAQAYVEPKAWARAIYADETPVGFVMLYDDPDTPEYYLWRLMIGGPHQGKGFGRRAIALVVDYVRSRPNAVELVTSYVPIDGGPEPFYRGLGFVPTGEMDGDEVVTRLVL